MAGDELSRSRSESGSSVPHEGKHVFDVTTRKWYGVHDSYRLGHDMQVWLKPPGGYDPRHLSTQDFVAEIGSRLLLKQVTRSLGESGDWDSAVGSMAYNVFTDELGLPDDVLTCPQCGATCEDGQIRMHHAFVSYDYPDEGPLLHCRQCRAEYGVRPDVIDRD
jgi:hypothetical protein